MNSDPDVTEPERGALGQRAARGGSLVLAGQAAKFFVNFLAMIVMARLLVPQDFGVVAMVTAVTGLLLTLKDLGLSEAMLQKQGLASAELDALFRINVLTGVVLGAVLVLMGPGLAWFYGDHRVEGVAAAMSISFVFYGLTAVPQSLLIRKLQLGRLAGVEILAIGLGSAVGVLAAWLGAGYWALVLQQITPVGCEMVGVWLLSAWRPRRGGVRGTVASMLRFGAHLSGARVIAYCGHTVDKIVLGWSEGARALGAYSIPFKLLTFPGLYVSMPLAKLAVSTLSRLQGDRERYRKYYCRAMLVVASLCVPYVVFVITDADRIVLSLLGGRWRDSIAILRILGPAAFPSAMHIASYWVYLSHGRTDRQMRWTVVESLVVAGAVLAGSRWGVLGIATGYSLAVCGMYLPGVAYSFGGTSLRLRDLLRSVARPLFASAAGCLTVIAFSHLLPGPTASVLRLVLDGMVFAGVYAVVWTGIPGGRLELVDVLASVLGRRRVPLSE